MHFILKISPETLHQIFCLQQHSSHSVYTDSHESRIFLPFCRAIIITCIYSICLSELSLIWIKGWSRWGQEILTLRKINRPNNNNRGSLCSTVVLHCKQLAKIWLAYKLQVQLVFLKLKKWNWDIYVFVSPYVAIYWHYTILLQPICLDIQNLELFNNNGQKVECLTCALTIHY